MISIEGLRGRQANARRMAESLGLSGAVKDLTNDELEVFGRAFERQFIVQYAERPMMQDLYVRHLDAILLGAMVAKAQMDSNIDGEMPGSGKIGGPIPPRAGFFGIGDDWDDVGAITTGSEQNWIHSGTTLMGGTAGNPIKIGENAVHVIIAVGSYHPSPKIEAMKFEIDGKERPVIITGWAQRQPGSVHVKELENEFLFKKNTTVKATVFASAQHGTTVNDIPYLIGASYIAEAQLRVLDVATLPGTTNAVVMTT